MRREKLSRLTPQSNTNAGLWLDKFLGDGNDQPKTKLVKEVAATIKTSDIYPAFFARWKESLQNDQTMLAEAKVEGRLAIGLGDDGVLETSITLHHTYGVPYLRGSALKGLAASFARNRIGGMWEKKSKAYQVVFGETDEAGYITFHDALYLPGSGHNGQALHADIMTVHHSDYYGNKPDAPPADWDEPTPVPFLSATGKYLIAVSAPKGCEQWRQAALDILKLALAEEGIGAKTSSGYGCMKLEVSK
jgi:CRISPR-associated protein Cmr6